MAVNRIINRATFAPYAQTSITPITAGNSKFRIVYLSPVFTAYAQTSITPTSFGSSVKPFPPLPGVAVSGGSYGFPT